MSERVVNHPKYGRGVVQESRYRGFELRVEFDDGVTRWVRLEDYSLFSTKQKRWRCLTTTISTRD